MADSKLLIFCAEKRAKKMEEMAARRNKGEDDGTSVSGLSKLRRRRKKMVQDEVNADSKELPKEDPAPVIQEETVEEKQRRLRAGKIFVIVMRRLVASHLNPNCSYCQ